MYKPYKKRFENAFLKNGSKHKAEREIKKIFKKMQKSASKKSGLNVLKQNITENYGVFAVGKQTVKRGKRKKTLQTTIVFSSEKARFSQACKNLISETSKTVKGNSFVDKFVTRLKNDEQSNGVKKTELLGLTVRKKNAVKFRW